MVDFDLLTETLSLLDVKYNTLGCPVAISGFASLKKIEKNKIYYSVKKVDDSVDHSVVLIPSVECVNNNNNFYIILDNPQVTFYKLMRSIYQDKKPRIASSVIISNTTTIGDNLSIDHNSIIRATSIGNNVSIGANVVIHDNVTIGNDVTISDNTVIGAKGVAWIWDEVSGERVIQPQIGYVEIGDSVFIGSNVTIVRGSVNESTIVCENCLISHGTQIGHGVQINQDTHIANNCALAGNVVIGRECFLGAGVVLASHVKVAQRVTIGAGATISKSIETEETIYMTMPARAIPSQNNLNGVPKRK